MSGTEDEGAGAGQKAVVTDLESELTFEDIERLFFPTMDVLPRTMTRRHGLLQEGKRSTSLAPRALEVTGILADRTPAISLHPAGQRSGSMVFPRKSSPDRGRPGGATRRLLEPGLPHP